MFWENFKHFGVRRGNAQDLKNLFGLITDASVYGAILSQEGTQWKIESWLKV